MNYRTHVTNKKKRSQALRAQELSELSVFVRSAVRCGCRYLAVGGPTSRLESKLIQAGEYRGYKVEVFTTPTGVFVSALPPGRHRVVTFVGRVKEVSFNLSELETMERILQNMANGTLSARQALYYVRANDLKINKYELLLTMLGAFLIGLMSALLSYGSGLVALCAGVITLLVYFLNGPIKDRLRLNSVFSIFIVAMVGFGLSAWASIWLQIPMEAVSLGSLIILAPGLMLTTAIAEVAEQNYVSGIVKLMKSAINLMGMLISYLLILDAIRFFGFEIPPMVAGEYSMKALGPYVPYLVYTSIALGMCLSLRVPKKAIPGATLVAFASWYVFNFLQSPEYYVTATFVAALTVGLISLIFGALYKLPSQIFSVPGILALVPGVLAMSSFSSIAKYDGLSVEIGIKVLLIASSIVFGLFTARVPFMVNIKEEYGLEPEHHGSSKESPHLNFEESSTPELSKESIVSSDSTSTMGMF